MNIINWKQVSRILAGGTENIRSNKIPKKYEGQVKELTDFTESWMEKHSNKN